jgi:hypothetical protein
MDSLEQDEPASPPGLFSSLVYPDYRRLSLATACGQAALWALIVLRGPLVYELTQSNAWVGFVTMAAHLPSLVVTPFAGFLADRFERRSFLALTYSLNLGATLRARLLNAIALHQLMQQGAPVRSVMHFTDHSLPRPAAGLLHVCCAVRHWLDTGGAYLHDFVRGRRGAPWSVW